MKAYLTRRYRFPASHRLHSDALSGAENFDLYGKCNHPFGHGHNYGVEITVSGQVDPTTGMVCNLADLDGFVNQNIMSVLDHSHLNELDAFREVVPTTENLCLEIQGILQRGFNAANVEKVKIQETRKNSFETFSPRDGGQKIEMR
ncbi:MAG TPA: 6-carboxytetrahydropterin synthase [Terriglobales bacterium]|nr:6-carboxytetrahydropterin synthase [Terriglobales bacterium]